LKHGVSKNDEGVDSALGTAGILLFDVLQRNAERLLLAKTLTNGLE